MILSLRRLSFHFQALDAVRFPPDHAANLLRGALGGSLRTALFAPVDPEGPSGLMNRPRPFVFRGAHLDGQLVGAGEQFHFALHLFDLQPGVSTEFIEAFRKIFREGIGPGRRRGELLDVTDSLLEFPLALGPPVARLSIRFLTPTELKAGGKSAIRPEFAVLFARVRDRISGLRSFYGPGPFEMDHRAMGERAARIEMVRCDIRHVEANRRSSRTGQTHSIGGFVGQAEYRGELGEFVPFLTVAQFTGVGRHTVWGNGEIEILTEPEP